MNTISAISSKNTLRCHRRISETPLKFSNILVISRLKNHIIKGSAIPKIDWHYLCFYEFFVKNCCPLLTTLLSGSPIIQNDKIVGAVTHVLINDPTTGYGIFAENMLVNMPLMAR